MTLSAKQQSALLLLGWLQLQYGHPDRARILLDALLALHPEHKEGRRALVVSLLKLQKGSMAKEHCTLLQEQGEQSAALWLCVSRACQQEGNLEEARSAYQRYLAQGALL
ncbi:type III secretion system chaperone SctY [Photorhabdus laumondii subsp. laumondii]|uniref:Type III secretion protein SctY n=2 Tax=Photorhabdus laumondii subsp. laumondii TaxID=141679 RepID=Q7N0W7_PHOLL|nr:MULTISPECIES: type III secretion system chaperone SctY [Photorhabdus]AWK43381.1 type III secretion protein [Photorhabdus laumondii subsp. laumondii]AXG44054.1 type III secretion protein [Photorhabdus laumondii subsp. laumondii]AXG48687.1 type III secretion protein [Photorhabdus laumondii subsp. laumondii]KTL63084.1 type III secretion protein [Photorhabdus laumondii subsp. laumondii]MCC8383221.1 type III secretion system chaperone SctY [Photorhabdus laumondii]